MNIFNIEVQRINFLAMNGMIQIANQKMGYQKNTRYKPKKYHKNILFLKYQLYINKFFPDLCGS